MLKEVPFVQQLLDISPFLRGGFAFILGDGVAKALRLQTGGTDSRNAGGSLDNKLLHSSSQPFLKG